MNTDLGDSGFLSYHADGKQVLISEFGSTRYKCRGACSCGRTKRRNSAILSKPFVFFVTAATALLAKRLTEDRYDEICEEWMNDEEDCLDEEIRGVMESCSVEEYQEERDRDHYKPDEFDDGRWLCSGNCLPKRILRDELYDKTVKEFGWWKEYMGGFPHSIHRFMNEFERVSITNDCHLMQLEARIKSKTENAANYKFVKGPLRQYCEGYSEGEVSVDDDPENIDKVIELITRNPDAYEVEDDPEKEVDEDEFEMDGSEYLGHGFQNIVRVGNRVKLELCTSFCCFDYVNPSARCIQIEKGGDDDF